MSVPGQPRPGLLSASIAAVLLTAGCGSSSKGTSTQSSTGAPTAQLTAPTSHSQPPSPAAPAVAGTVTGAAGGVSASLHAGTHHPKVNHAWPIRFTVTRGGQPVRASVSYEYLFAGQVVARRSHYTFNGHFSDIFRWPSSAVGYPLRFRAVIVSTGGTINLDYPVQVTG